MRRSPTINLVGFDPVLCERIRASLGRSPFHFSPTAEPLVGRRGRPVRRCRPARRHPRRREESPVIAHGPAGLMRSAFLAGCADYLRDPWTPEELGAACPGGDLRGRTPAGSSRGARRASTGTSCARRGGRAPLSPPRGGHPPRAPAPAGTACAAGRPRLPARWTRRGSPGAAASTSTSRRSAGGSARRFPPRAGSSSASAARATWCHSQDATVLDNNGTRNGRLRIGVKEPLKVPFIFLFILICTTFVCAVLDMLSAWGLYESAGRSFTLASAVQKLPRSLYDVLVPSVVLSIVLLGFRLARRRVLAFLGPVHRPGSRVHRPGERHAPGPARSPVLRRWRRIPGAVLPALHVRARRGKDDQRPLPQRHARARHPGLRPGARRCRFTVFPGGNGGHHGRRLGSPPRVRGRSRSPATPDLSWTSVFAADRFTSLFLRDIRTMTSDFQRLLVELAGRVLRLQLRPGLPVHGVAHAPENHPLAAGEYHAARDRGAGVFFPVPSPGGELRAAAGAGGDRPFVARMFPSAAFVGLGVIFLLVDILFIPADRWVSEPPE